MSDKLKDLLDKREDILYHMKYKCGWDSFEYMCYEEDLREVEREIEELKGKEKRPTD